MQRRSIQTQGGQQYVLLDNQSAHLNSYQQVWNHTVDWNQSFQSTLGIKNLTHSWMVHAKSLFPDLQGII